MTHTLETTAISRVVARALRLNEDLVEAIGLGHDMGHTPFGHAGEDALDEAVQERFGRRFRHNEQSLRIARSLNLTARGVRRHPHAHGRAGAGHARGEDRPARRPGRVHQPRHRRRACATGCCARTIFPRTRSPCSGRPARRGSTRSSTTSSSRPKASTTSASRRRSGRRCSRCARSCSSASTSARRRLPSTSGRTRSSTRSSTTSSSAATTSDEIVDYIAGMTDRFALDYAESL